MRRLLAALAAAAVLAVTACASAAPDRRDTGLAMFQWTWDAIAAESPMHPSYEDRVGVPDVVLASVPPELTGHLSEVWGAPLADAGAGDATVLHLHHLTPQLDAAQRGWPAVPKVVHLHGTEMKMVAGIDERVLVAAALGADEAVALALAAGSPGATSCPTDPASGGSAKPQSSSDAACCHMSTGCRSPCMRVTISRRRPCWAAATNVWRAASV